jgi:hypothetical protein
MPNTHVPAAGEAMPAAEVMPTVGRFSRRALLGTIATIPAIGAATAAPLAKAPVSAPKPDSSIMEAFRQWDALYAKTYDPELEEIPDELWETMSALEKVVKAMPARSPTDLLLKVFMSSSYCAFSLDEEVDALIVEARAVLS